MTDERPPSSVNFGIHVSGGTLHSHATAGGPGARAEAWGTSTSSLDPDTVSVLRDLVDSLSALLRERADQGADVGAMVAAVDEAAAELGTEAPERSRLMTVFTRVAEAATPLGVIAGTVEKILQLLGAR